MALGSNKVSVWEISSGKQLLTFGDSHVDSIVSASFAPDGSVVATGSMDSTVRLWNPRTGKQVGVAYAGAGAGCAHSVRFDQNRPLLLIAGDEHRPDEFEFVGMVALCNISTNAETTTVLPDRATCAVRSSDGNLTAVATGLGEGAYGDNLPVCIRVWETDSEKHPREMLGHDGRVLGLSISADSKSITSVSADNTFRCWDMKSGKQLDRFEITGHVQTVKQALGGPARINRAVFSTDGKVVATSGLFCDSVILWDMQAQKPLHTLVVRDSLGCELAISADGRLLATGHWMSDGAVSRISLWDLRKGIEIGHFQLEDDIRVTSLAFAPDDKQLFSGLDDSTGLVWDIHAAYDAVHQ